MSVLINKRPIKLVFEDYSAFYNSIWSCGFNPIVYTLQVPDYSSNTTYILIEIYEKGSNVLLGKLRVTPRASQEFNVDISNTLRSYLYSEYNFSNGSQPNAKDLGNTLTFYIKYYQYVNSSLVSSGSDASNPITVTCGAKQIGDQYGQNLADYLPTSTVIPTTIIPIVKAKWLTRFKEPKYYPGYPFTISFIYPELLAGVEVQRYTQDLNINKDVITTTTTQLDRSQINHVNHLKLKSSYGGTVEFVKLQLRTGDVVPEGYTYPGYVTDGYNEAI